MGRTTRGPFVRVPTRIHISQGIIQTIAIPVKRLRIGPIRHYRIRTNKPPDSGIVVAGIVEVKTGAVKSLAGEFLVRSQETGLAPCLAEGEVFDICHQAASGIGGQGGAC